MSGGSRAPWEEPNLRDSQPQAEWQPPPGQPAPVRWQPAQKSGLKLFPTDRRRQVLVIALLVALFVVGPFLFFVERQLRTSSKGQADEKQASAATQQQEATELLQRAAAQLRAAYNGNGGNAGRVASEFEAACNAGQWETAHYKITQIGFNSNSMVEKSFDVVVYCNPKPGAADQDAAGTMKFLWDAGGSSIVWR